jgi:hypothetical protein
LSDWWLKSAGGCPLNRQISRNGEEQQSFFSKD